jgi:hypothetical protein
MNKSKRRDMKPMRKKSGKMRLESSLRNKESMKPLLLLRLNLIVMLRNKPVWRSKNFPVYQKRSFYNKPERRKEKKKNFMKRSLR